MLLQTDDQGTTTTTLLYGPSPQGSPFPPSSQQHLDTAVWLWLLVVAVVIVGSLAVMAWRRSRQRATAGGAAARR